METSLGLGGQEKTLQEPGKGIDRRTMLKAAAAAGAGAAAWSAPNITTLGFAPAYAQVCTVAPTAYFLGSRNTSCNCEELDASGTPVHKGEESAQYKLIKGTCDGFNGGFPGTAILTEGSCSGEAIDDSGGTTTNSSAGCPGQEPSGRQWDAKGAPLEVGNAGVCVTPTPGSTVSGQYCRVKIELVENGACSDNVIGTVTTDSFVGPTWHKLPPILRSEWGNCAFFLRYFVECAPDVTCFDLIDNP